MLSFWIIIAIIIGIAFFLITSNFWRAGAIHATRQMAAEALRDAQLAELETGLSSGQIQSEEADGLRNEIQRAFARATRRGEDEIVGEGPTWPVIAILAAAMIGAIALYARIGVPGASDWPLAKRQEMQRPSQEIAIEMLEAEGTLPVPLTPDAELAEIIPQLEKAIADNPDDARGWEFLARIRYSLDDFAGAAEAQAELIRIKGDGATSGDKTQLAEVMILAVNGYVSPEAETILREVLTVEPDNQIARFYAASVMRQAGDVDGARVLLQSLLDEGVDNAEWHLEIETQIAELSERAPTAEDIANAADMNDADRTAMIEGMVAQLNERLATEGGSPAEWAQLVNALRVLGRDEQADAILSEAREKFPNAPEVQAIE